jgi:hypothetical protein
LIPIKSPREWKIIGALEWFYDYLVAAWEEASMVPEMNEDLQLVEAGNGTLRLKNNVESMEVDKLRLAIHSHPNLDEISP